MAGYERMAQVHAGAHLSRNVLCIAKRFGKLSNLVIGKLRNRRHRRHRATSPKSGTAQPQLSPLIYTDNTDQKIAEVYAKLG